MEPRKRDIFHGWVVSCLVSPDIGGLELPVKSPAQLELLESWEGDVFPGRSDFFLFPVSLYSAAVSQVLILCYEPKHEPIGVMTRWISVSRRILVTKDFSCLLGAGVFTLVGSSGRRLTSPGSGCKGSEFFWTDLVLILT